MTRLVLVADYDPGWPEVFGALAQPIAEVVTGLGARVEHVGSTSVPGLAAKPIIDMGVVVPDQGSVKAAIEALRGLGYEHRGDLGIPGREAFHQPAGLPQHHLYVYAEGCLPLRNHLALRDYLRARPQAAAEYGRLKKDLAQKFPHDIDSYVDGKTEFILRILEVCGLTADERAAVADVNQIGEGGGGEPRKNRLAVESPLAIARREEARQAEMTVRAAAEGEPIGGGWMAFAGVGSWANQACGLGLAGEVSPAELDRLVEFYVDRGVEPRIELCSHADTTLVEGLAARGFVLREFENVYATRLKDDAAERPFTWPIGIDVVPVNAEVPEELDEHIRTCLSGFVEQPSAAMLETARRSAQDPYACAFNAVCDGKVVGGGAMQVGHGVAALAGTTVRPEYRRRGIQLALMWERMRVARNEHECELAVVHSAPGISTERNASRLGFWLAYTKVVLVKPGPGLAVSL